MPLTAGCGYLKITINKCSIEFLRHYLGRAPESSPTVSRILIPETWAHIFNELSKHDVRALAALSLSIIN
jgi:hypothetical protein